MKNLIDKHDEFAVIPCQCRLIGEMSGEPCDVAPSEMGCFVGGLGARDAMQNKLPGARSMNKQEAIEFLKETEKAGLVHNAIWDKGNESSIFICNCCKCHCGVALFPAQKMHIKGVHASNFRPKFNMELCSKCETCLRKCPKEAIYHKWPLKSDSSDEEMILREDMCIGCGICAVNCPKEAIKMIKIIDIEPPEKNMIGNKTFLKLIGS
ncbi:MAG: 4Fe-4S binding protein [Promethearchaeota archaeon]